MWAAEACAGPVPSVVSQTLSLESPHAHSSPTIEQDWEATIAPASLMLVYIPLPSSPLSLQSAALEAYLSVGPPRCVFYRAAN